MDLHSNTFEVVRNRGAKRNNPGYTIKNIAAKELMIQGYIKISSPRKLNKINDFWNSANYTLSLKKHLITNFDVRDVFLALESSISKIACKATKNN